MKKQGMGDSRSEGFIGRPTASSCRMVMGIEDLDCEDVS